MHIYDGVDGAEFSRISTGRLRARYKSGYACVVGRGESIGEA